MDQVSIKNTIKSNNINRYSLIVDVFKYNRTTCRPVTEVCLVTYPSQRMPNGVAKDKEKLPSVKFLIELHHSHAGNNSFLPIYLYIYIYIYDNRGLKCLFKFRAQILYPSIPRQRCQKLGTIYVSSVRYSSSNA